MSLKLKLSILTSLLILFILTSVGYLIIRVRSQEIEKELIARNEIIAERVVPDIANDFSNYYVTQFSTLAGFVTHWIEKYPDMLHLRLLNLSGEVLMDSSEIKDGKYSGTDPRAVDAPMRAIIENHVAAQDFAVYQGSRVIRIFVPYIDNYGTYRLMMEFEFSLQSVNLAIFQAITFFLLLFGASLAIGVVLTVLLAQRITKPIMHLTESAKQISAGNLDVTIIPESRDEIGALATTFTQMASNLKKSHDDLVAKITELERVIRVTVGRELKMIELKQKLDNSPPKKQTQEAQPPETG